MDIEASYRAALNLTQKMLTAATALDWAALAPLEVQRAALLASTPPLSTLKLTPAQTSSLAQFISEMERDNAEILDIAQVAQEHVKILLRLDQGQAAIA
jgi:Flagellar protein FliT